MLVNILLLNSLWFASVLGAANELLWPAFVVLILLLAYNFYFTGMKALDYKIIAVSIVSGLLIDGVMMNQGLVVYALDNSAFSLAPPIWIMLLWIGFGATIRIGMQWLLNNPIVGGLVMLIGAPLSYVSAGKLGAASMPNLWFAMAFIGISWYIYFMLIVYLTQNQETDNAVV